jgi:pyruvate/2-oxoglutarate/acetoin dehydrogenase E1 component
MDYKETIAHAIHSTLERDPKAIVLGEGVADQKGIFGTTKLAHDAFPDRVIETPLSENMLTGALAGLAHNGYHPIYVHARAEFSLLAFEHMVNTIAKWPWLHDGKPLPIIIRMLVGRGWGQGPTHSQSFHDMLSQIPGLNVVYPVELSMLQHQYDFTASARVPCPRIIFEPRRMYDMEYPVPCGFKHNADVTLRPIGDTVVEACIAVQELQDRFGILASVEPTQVFPFDMRAHDTPQVLISSMPHQSIRGEGVLDLHPRDTPTPTAFKAEQDWYVCTEEIVEAACLLLGRKYTDSALGTEAHDVIGERDGRKEAF